MDGTVQAVKADLPLAGRAALDVDRRWRVGVCASRPCRCRRGVTLISRLRLDAQRYTFPDRNAPRHRSPKPLKGKRLPALKDRVAEALAYGKDLEIPW